MTLLVQAAILIFQLRISRKDQVLLWKYFYCLFSSITTVKWIRWSIVLFVYYLYWQYNEKAMNAIDKKNRYMHGGMTIWYKLQAQLLQKYSLIGCEKGNECNMINKRYKNSCCNGCISYFEINWSIYVKYWLACIHVSMEIL